MDAKTALNHTVIVGALHICGRLAQFILRDFAFPERFLCLLQLAETAHAGVTDDGCCGEWGVGHPSSLLWEGVK